MEGAMRVAVTTGKKKIEWCGKEIPQPSPEELQIKLGYVGVCGSDPHFYSEGCLANWIPGGPLILEHEPGGVVSTIGEGVTRFEIRDRVALELRVPCGHCEDCLKGRYNLCRSVRFMATLGEKDGIFSEYCTHAADVTFKLPDNALTMEGGLMESLVVSMHAYELSNVELGGTTVMLGAECVDLVTLMSLKTQGASEIYVVDVLDERLEKTRELGAARVFNSKNENTEEFVKMLPGDSVDQVYECAGNRIITLQTYCLIKRAGKTTPVGVSPEPVLELDITTLNITEEVICSVYRYHNLYPSVINAVNRGLILLKGIVSRTFDFKGVIEGVGYSLNRRSKVIKTVIRM